MAMPVLVRGDGAAFRFLHRKGSSWSDPEDVRSIPCRCRTGCRGHGLGPCRRWRHGLSTHAREQRAGAAVRQGARVHREHRARWLRSAVRLGSRIERRSAPATWIVEVVSLRVGPGERVGEMADMPDAISVRDAVEIVRMPWLSAVQPWSRAGDTSCVWRWTLSEWRKAHCLWRTLSGGERQRVHIARARATARRPAARRADPPS